MSAETFFKSNPGVETIEAFCVDVNGTLRGKILPAKSAAKIFGDGLRLPFSVLAVDIWGQDVLPAGLVAETGDTDGICKPSGDLSVMPWASTPTAQLPMSMYTADGAPFFGDPRHRLSHILDLFRKDGLTPVVAVELEFYLFDPKRTETGAPQPPLSPQTGRRAVAPQICGVAETNDFAAVLADIRQYCKQLGVPADTTLSENGPAQFEINLSHVPDALQAADHATMLKRIVKGAAQKHGMLASFMAKPYGDVAGSGMHVHFSVLGKDGKNIFAGTDDKGSPALRHAIAGLLAHMKDSTAVLAPNLNSYRRFRKGSHAPTSLSWGYDNRSAALRIPQSDLAATRIEHRVGGADANPYLVLAVVLAAAYDGIKAGKEPAAASAGNVYESTAERLPSNWGAALDLFEKSDFMTIYLGENYKKLYLACKSQEKEELEAQVSSAEHDAYLRDL